MTARALPEWIGKTPDEPVPPRVRVRVFQKFSGVCPVCTRSLRAGQWQLDHTIALTNGGENRESNLRPVCTSPCHSQKTAADVAEKSRVAQRAASHIGVKRKRRTIPGRHFDGTPIPSRLVE